MKWRKLKNGDWVSRKNKFSVRIFKRPHNGWAFFIKIKFGDGAIFKGDGYFSKRYTHKEAKNKVEYYYGELFKG